MLSFFFPDSIGNLWCIRQATGVRQRWGLWLWRWIWLSWVWRLLPNLSTAFTSITKVKMATIKTITLSFSHIIISILCLFIMSNLPCTFRQICQGNNSEYHVEDTHHFQFASSLRGHDTYRWRNVSGQVRVLAWKSVDTGSRIIVFVPKRLSSNLTNMF